MKASVNITGQRIADLVCCAIEGGSNYWCKGIYLVTPNQDTLSDSIWYCSPELWDGDFTISILEDTEQEDDNGDLIYKDHIVNQESFQKAFDLMAEKYPWHLANFMNENEDAETGDVFLQLATFGDIVYG